MRTSLRAVLFFAFTLPSLVSVAFAQEKPGEKTHLGMPASDLLNLGASLEAGETKSLELLKPGGDTAPFVLPDNTLLVLTDLQCLSYLNSQGQFFGLSLKAGATTVFVCKATTETWGADQHVNLTSGIVLSVNPTVTNDSSGIAVFKAYGYLVKNK